MDRNQFKLIHSELIQQVQCVESNLKIIYAAMHKGNFNNNLKSVEKMNLGKIARELEDLDNSDGMPEFSEEEYNTIDAIREIRNYSCHKCYLVPTERCNNTRKPLKTLGKTRVTWYNVCKQIRKF